MSLHQRVQDDLRAAMKARDRQRTSALRLLLAALKNAAVDAGVGAGGQLPDDEVERVVQREVKRRRESAATYRDAGREDRATAEEAEAVVYGAYLPEPLSDDELAAIVDQAIAEVGADGPGAMGPVMRAVMPRVGSRADGQRVSAVVRSRLNA